MSEDFWTSDTGIRLRTKYLAQFIIIRTWNRALQMHGLNAGIAGFTYLTAGDDSVCIFCSPYHGKFYKAGQFMKHLPVHFNCRCMYDAVVNTSVFDMYNPMQIPIIQFGVM